MKLAKLLIKLGETNPELRDHLRPVLDKIAGSLDHPWGKAFEVAAEKAKVIGESIPGIAEVSLFRMAKERKMVFAIFNVVYDGHMRLGRDGSYYPCELNFTINYDEDDDELIVEHKYGRDIKLALDWFNVVGRTKIDENKFITHISDAITSNFLKILKKVVAAYVRKNKSALITKRQYERLLKQKAESGKSPKANPEALVPAVKAALSKDRNIYVNDIDLPGTGRAEDNEILVDYYDERVPDLYDDPDFYAVVDDATDAVEALMKKELRPFKSMITKMDIQGDMDDANRFLLSIVLK